METVIVDPADTWFARALTRRAAEESGELAVVGARFNSFIGTVSQD